MKTLHRPLAPLALVLAACSACGDDGNGMADAAPPDPCAPQMSFVGEFVDWDSGAPSTGFLGIPGAVFTHRAMPSITTTTAPNGRVMLCVPAMDGFVDVATMSGSGYVSGVAVVNRAVYATQAPISFRSFRDTRAADFGFSPSAAHVFVHVHGGVRTVSTGAAATVSKVFNGADWVDGTSGTDIYLGNITGPSTTMLTVSGGNAIGAGTIPLSVGQFTFVTVVATD